MRYWLICTCFFLWPGNIAIAQQKLSITEDPLINQLQLYKSAQPASVLFVHFDKTIYTNNETAWFTGYLLNEIPSNIIKHNIMSVALVRNRDSAIIKQQKFLMASGLSFGSMLLPDSLLAGDYHFLVSTNRVSKGKPDVIFIQPATIKTNISSVFNASIKLLEPGIIGKKPNQVLLSATTKDARFLPRPVAVSYRYGAMVKKAATNVSGELILKLDEQENVSDPNVYIKLKYGKDSSFLNLPLPVTYKKAKVGFYPEGGNLVNGIPGYIAWEVKDQQLAVVALKAQLYKDGKVIDTIETNSYGIGKFLLTPERNSVYQVKLLHSGFADSAYQLPAILDKGLVLSAARAVVKDTLTVQLKDNHKEIIFIRVHDFRETYIYNNLYIKTSPLILKIPLTEVPKGIKTLTISDSLGRPLAERMFFAHYDASRPIRLSTDQQVYEQRKKVTLKISLNKADSLGLVSIACVQESRLSSRLNTDIESYTYLTNQLSTLPPYGIQRGYEEPGYVENILLVKGWRRYTWAGVMQAKAADTVKKYDNTSLSIQVTNTKRPIAQPIQIGILNTGRAGLHTTDEHGNFEFVKDEIMVEKEKPVYVFIGEKKLGNYQIKINDPYPDLNKSYLKLFTPEYRSVPSSVQNNNVLALKSNESAIRLKEVEITSGRGDGFYAPNGSNACGDYVCRYNILNCMNHVGDAGNTQPVAGRSYRFMGGTTVYQACKETTVTPGMVLMDGIYSKKEFYLNDYAEPLEPALVSTIYWNNGFFLNRAEREITFYTSDITGKFKVIVQGLGTSNVLYGDCTFEVKGK
jgi:hypothetical protein